MPPRSGVGCTPNSSYSAMKVSVSRVADAYRQWAMDGRLDVLGEQAGDRAAVDGGELFVAEVESILS